MKKLTMRRECFLIQLLALALVCSCATVREPNSATVSTEYASTAVAVDGAALAATEGSANEPSVRSNVHFMPSRRAVGDVMPFYWNGEYHVFYLMNPTGNYDVNWEHIVSSDLVHWKELPPALRFDPKDPTGPEGSCMFTGDIVEKDGVFHAWYTSWNPRNPEGREFLSHATSRDLINWTKHPEHMIAPDGVHYANHRYRDFRDPEIFWNPEREEYWMIIFANVPNEWGGRYGLLTSSDLISWKQEAPIEGVPGGETPNYLKIEDTHYIISNDYGYSYAENVSGPFKRPKLWNTITVSELDTSGQAAKTVWDGKRHVWFGGWTGRSMPIPREVYAGPEGLLYMKPVAEVIAYFNETALDLTEEPSETVVDVPLAYMVDCQIKMDPASRFTISFDGKYHMSLLPSQALLSVTGLDIGRPCPMDTSRPVKIQVFVDETLIECFVNDQFAQSCIVNKWEPMEGTLGFSTERGTVEVLKFRVKIHP